MSHEPPITVRCQGQCCVKFKRTEVSLLPTEKLSGLVVPKMADMSMEELLYIRNHKLPTVKIVLLRDFCISCLVSSLYSALHTICPTCPPIVLEMAIILAVMRQPLVEKTSPSHGRDGRPAVTRGTRWNCQALTAT